MTCIIGLVEDDKVYLGGDSAGVDGNWNVTLRADKKVFKRDGYLIGFTTSYRMGQVLQYMATLPTPPDPLTLSDTDRLDWLMEFMVVEFVESIRKAFDKAGYTKIENSREEGGQFLVGVNGRLFCIGSDFQVGESMAGFDAVGSGATYAIGAMAVSRRKPINRIKQALAVAEQFNAGVRGPFIVVHG